MTTEPKPELGTQPSLPLHDEVKSRFGVLPNFFRLVPEAPEVMANLWGFAKFGYLDLPLPSLFKERLFVYLSRFCDVRYCIARHVGFLVGLGRPAGDEHSIPESPEQVVRLIRRPFPRGDDLSSHIRLLASDVSVTGMPAADSAEEEALFACLAHVFLQSPQALDCLEAVRKAIGEVALQQITVFLTFVRAAHFWTKVHPELVLEEDIKTLLVTHEALAECILNDPEASSSEITQVLREELTQLRREQELRFERDRASQALAESERRFRAFVTASSDVMYGMNPDWSEMQSLDGRGFIQDAEAPVSDWIHRNLPPFEHARVLNAIREAVSRKEPFELEHQVLRVDGTLGWTLSRAVPILDDDGRIVEWFGMASDVTSRKEAEHEKRRLDEGRRLALDSAQLGSWNMDPGLQTLETDKRFREIFGIARDDLSFRDAVAIIHPEDRDQVGDAIAASTRLDDPQPYSLEYRVVHPDGSTRWVFAKGRSNFAGEGSDRQLTSFDGTLADITDRKEAEEARRRRTHQLQKLTEISARINSAHDVNSVVGVVTEEARKLIGTHQAATSMVLDPHFPQPNNVVSVSGKSPHEFLPPDIDGLEIYEALNATNKPIRLTRSELDADPRWQTLGRLSGPAPSPNGWLAAPLMGRNGKIMGLIQLSDKDEGNFTNDDEVILVQLSQLTAIAIMNARLYQELRSNDERKDEFLAMLAHELRNPLSAIGNAVKVASKTGAREHVEWSMEVINRQMQHLSRLIDDLMDVSRITRGKIELRRDVLDVTPILMSATATVQSLIEERKHTLEMVLEPGNLWVNVDPTRLEQGVVNLLNNAAKYSDNEGHIRLAARRERNEVVISIKDRGVGIPPEKLPELFELFAQADRSLARSEGGLGIGLTVVKKLVEMHGGIITGESEGLGKGSEFVIRLPTAERPAPVTSPEGVPPEEAIRKARILVVDDNVDTARGMARLLKLIGHDVAVAHDGPKAIEVAREYNPEFILLDIGLPGMSGYEVAAKLRREECCLDAVIVAVSGYGQDEDRRRSKASGFDHHLTKPLDHEALMSLLSAKNNCHI
jgi:PAS domain S-box-containing protein